MNRIRTGIPRAPGTPARPGHIRATRARAHRAFRKAAQNMIAWAGRPSCLALGRGSLSAREPERPARCEQAGVRHVHPSSHRQSDQQPTATRQAGAWAAVPRAAAPSPVQDQAGPGRPQPVPVMVTRLQSILSATH